MSSDKRRSTPDDDLIAAAQRQCEVARASASRDGAGSPARRVDDRSRAASLSLKSDSIAGYELIGERHRGGQGVVYEAIQIATKRHVAIKMLYDSASGPVASQRLRFEREVEILGQLRHPNVVTVHDSGVTKDRLYYVMDLVEGQRLDDWVAVYREVAGPSKSGRTRSEPLLTLFIKICDAVNAAHLRGVIHRDLKPANILIDAIGEPRVLDFGLAKFPIESPDDGSDVPSMTQPGQFVGSLPWSSPEQSGGELDRIDTRTDVYAIGVLLYQALTGCFPYRVIGNVADVVQQIRNADPAPMNNPLPLTGPASNHRRRATSVGSIDDELETIVRKCLQKDQQRRYQTAGDVGRDLERYLRGQPIEAKHDSFAYIMRKHVRRHWLGFAAAGGVVAACAVGLGVSLFFWHQAAQQRGAAEREARRATAAEQVSHREAARAKEAEQVAQREVARTTEAEKLAQRRLAHAEAATQILQGMFGSLNDRGLLGKDRTVKQMLDDYAESAVKKAAGQPELEIVIRSTLADAYLSLGDAEQAEPHIDRTLELVREVHGETDPEYGVALNARAQLRQWRAQYPEAETDYRDAIQICSGDDHKSRLDRAIAQYGLSHLLERKGELKEAEQVAREAVESFRQMPDEKTRYGQTLRTLAMLVSSQRRYDEAGPMFEEATKTLIDELGEDDPAVAAAWNDHAEMLNQIGKSDEAIALYEKALAVFQHAHGEESPHAATCMGSLGVACLHAGKMDLAKKYLTDSLALRRRIFPDGHPDIAAGANNLATFSERSGDLDAAVPLYRECLAMLAVHVPATHPNVLTAKTSLARTLLARGKDSDAADAEKILRDVLAARRKSSIKDDAGVSNTLVLLGGALLRNQDWSGAEPMLREALEIRQKSLPAADWRVTSTRSMLGEAVLGLGRTDEARPMLLESYDALTASADAPPPRRREACARIVKLFEKLDDADQLSQWREKLAALP